MINRIRKRLKRFWKSLTKPNPYPQMVEVKELSSKAIKFRIHSDTEKFRTLGFGGEKQQLSYFLDYLEPTDIVYDIGASIGLTTLLAAVHCSKGQVIAFEPDGAIRERLLSNIRLNDQKHVSVLPYAVSNRDEEIQLYSAGADNISPSLSGKNVKNLILDSFPVTARTLDSLIASKEIIPATVLKIDIEGAEYNALLGAARFLRGDFGKIPRLIYIELHPDFLPDYKTNVDDVRQYIASFQYKRAWQIEREAQLHEIYVKD